MLVYLWLLPVGFLVGIFGTLIGAGGGFILAPLLLLLYPQEPAGIITCISLAVVFFNAASGSVAYARMRRIDYRTGLLFSAATVPGAVLGALTTTFIPRREFDLVFGVLMLLVAAFLLFPMPAAAKGPANAIRRGTTRTLIERDGTTHTYTFSSGLGLALSGAVGYLSSLLGTGGGIIHVPALIRLLNFPVHVATATSHFILAIMALSGTLVHVAAGSFTHGIRRTLVLSAGVLLGAQFGAQLSGRVHGNWIVRLLALALAFAGVRILTLAY